MGEERVRIAGVLVFHVGLHYCTSDQSASDVKIRRKRARRAPTSTIVNGRRNNNANQGGAIWIQVRSEQSQGGGWGDTYSLVSKKYEVVQRLPCLRTSIGICHHISYQIPLLLVDRRHSEASALHNRRQKAQVCMAPRLPRINPTPKTMTSGHQLGTQHSSRRAALDRRAPRPLCAKICALGCRWCNGAIIGGCASSFSSWLFCTPMTTVDFGRRAKRGCPSALVKEQPAPTIVRCWSYCLDCRKVHILPH